MSCVITVIICFRLYVNTKRPIFFLAEVINQDDCNPCLTQIQSRESWRYQVRCPYTVSSVIYDQNTKPNYARKSINWLLLWFFNLFSIGPPCHSSIIVNLLMAPSPTKYYLMHCNRNVGHSLIFSQHDRTILTSIPCSRLYWKSCSFMWNSFTKHGSSTQ